MFVFPYELVGRLSECTYAAAPERKGAFRSLPVNRKLFGERGFSAY